MINYEMLSIVAPAFAAGVMICLVHAALGIKVLKRGIIFIDLAIAQIAGLGLVVSSLFLKEESVFLSQIAALLSAVLASLFFRYIEKIAPKRQEAIIGCSFVLSASLAILFLANRADGADEVLHLLSGQMLFITWSDVFKHLPIYALIISIWFLKPKVQNGIGFYLLFALAITSSVQLVGVYVVFVSLIIPALCALNQKRPLLTAWSSGIISVLLGIFLALIFDYPAGATVVASYVIVASLFYLIKGRKPVVS